MSDDRPIGVFDSGLGGLTVAKEISGLLPHESIVYIGDTARVPYGNRSPATVIQFSQELVSFLLTKNVKAVVIACATASSVALDSLQKTFASIPIFGVIDATAAAAVTVNKNHQYGVIGTRATINSQSFTTAIKQKDVKATIMTQACPLFVPIIEEGIFEGDILNTVIDHYLSKFLKNLDTLILGCTHYPLISSTIQAYFPKTKLINPGVAVAAAVKQSLTDLNLLSHNQKSTHTLYATDVTDNFKQVGALFLGAPVTFHHHQLEN